MRKTIRDDKGNEILELHMILFTYSDGMTAAGIGTTVNRAEEWLRSVARAPYDTMKVVARDRGWAERLRAWWRGLWCRKR